MKHLMGRDEYLSKVNEGVIGNAIRAGVRKIKDAFSILMRKVKNFIAVFDDEGNVLPVVSVQAVIDNASGSESVNVYASQDIVDSVVAAGGKGCGTTAQEMDDGDDYEYMDEDSNEYKNFMSMLNIIKENYGPEAAEKLNERISYSKPGAKLNVCQLNSELFKEKLNKLIVRKNSPRKKSRFREDGYSKEDMNTNMLIFGAPGIGKSAIPNAVIKAYNEGKSAKDSVALITINCATLGSDGFMMPTIPLRKDIMGFIERNRGENEVLGTIDDVDKAELSAALRDQKDAFSAPPKWLPVYHRTGNDKINTILNEVANGGIWSKTGRDTDAIETGSGGIILFDELFRADPAIFNQLMTFLLDKRIDKWTLGSKWSIIACSNRPADSNIVSDVWEEVAEAAIADRFAEMWLLIPDPEGWKKYMRKQGLTGENEILFKFIFDPDSMEGSEYTRWHRGDSLLDIQNDSSQGNEKSKSETTPVTPRRWEVVWDKLVEYMDDNDLNSVLEIPQKDLSDLISGTFTGDFVQEFLNWFEAHTGNVDIEEIIKDPTNVFPSKNTVTDDAVIIRDLWEQFEKKYVEVKKNKDGEIISTKCKFVPDEEISNIFLWLGIHMRDQANLVRTDFFELLDKVCENETDNSLDKKTKMLQVLQAAWPESKDLEEEKEENPESYEEILEMMRTYFPWRLKGDKIMFIDEYGDEDNE